MVAYSATVKNEFLDCAGHGSLGLGVETHYSPSSFFQLVQKKTVLLTDGNGFSKESPSSTLTTLSISLSSMLISKTYKLLTFSHKLPG